MSERVAIGLDVGGTKVAGLVVDCEDGAVLRRLREETTAGDADATTRSIVGVARQLIAESDRDVVAVGVGAAGLVDLGGVMRFGPNIAWRDWPLGNRLTEGIGLPTIVENDANAAAWGEFRFGAGRGWPNLLMVTLGTGIGGGIIAGGQLLRGAHGFGGEIGHVVVDPTGPFCGCGNRGCWEEVASGRAIDRMGRETAGSHRGWVVLELAGGDPAEIQGSMVTEAARRGDPLATAILREVGHRVGQGIAGLANVLDPDVVIVGGGVVQAGELLLEPARVAFNEALEATQHRPEVPILAAALGADAGAVGAADLAVPDRPAAAGVHPAATG